MNFAKIGTIWRRVRALGTLLTYVELRIHGAICEANEANNFSIQLSPSTLSRTAGVEMGKNWL